ncbi:hypothetical protein Hanom_Chr13g01188021 [Helianthus anomalus]
MCVYVRGKRRKKTGYPGCGVPGVPGRAPGGAVWGTGAGPSRASAGPHTF